MQEGPIVKDFWAEMWWQNPGNNREQSRGLSQISKRKKGLKRSSGTLPGGRWKAKDSGGDLQTESDGWGRGHSKARAGDQVRQERLKGLCFWSLDCSWGRLEGVSLSQWALLMPCCPFILCLSVFHDQDQGFLLPRPQEGEHSGSSVVQCHPEKHSSFCIRTHG